MLTSDLVPCFVQTFKTDSKTGYEKALLVGVFDKTTTDLDCCISSSSRDTGKTRQPVAVVMQADGRRLLPLLRLRMGRTDLGAYRLRGHAGV